MRFLGVHIVDDWRNGLKWFSSQMWLAEMALQGTWASLDTDQRAALPHNSVLYLTIAIAVIGFLGRFVKQRLDPCPPPENPHDGLH